MTSLSPDMIFSSLTTNSSYCITTIGEISNPAELQTLLIGVRSLILKQPRFDQESTLTKWAEVLSKIQQEDVQRRPAGFDTLTLFFGETFPGVITTHQQLIQKDLGSLHPSSEMSQSFNPSGSSERFLSRSVPTSPFSLLAKIPLKSAPMGIQGREGVDDKISDLKGKIREALDEDDFHLVKLYADELVGLTHPSSRPRGKSVLIRPRKPE